MRKKLAIVILNCAIIFAGAFYAFGQEKVSELKDKRVTIKMDNKSLGEILYHLIVNYDIAIGLEESTLDSEHTDYLFKTNLPYVNKQSNIRDGVIPIKNHWFTINAENQRLEDVLNVIVKQMNNYKWEINDDVVNIFPVKGRDERYEKLLELNIKNFILEKPVRIFSIRTKILALPEITKFLDENKIFSSANRGFLENLSRKLDVEINLSNLTFRELLNRITKIKRGGWILRKNYLFGSKEKEYIEIDI
jgi:hypothetical protein